MEAEGDGIEREHERRHRDRLRHIVTEASPVLCGHKKKRNDML